MSEHPKGWGYCRASKSTQVLTIDAQQHDIRHYYAYRLKDTHHWDEETSWCVDSAITTHIDFFDRPEGMRFHQQVTRGDAIIVSKLDRAFRSVVDALTTLSVLDSLNVSLHVLDLNMDTSTPVGRAMFTVVAAFARLERDRISERTKEGLHASLRRRLANGKPLSSCPPLGFELILKGGKLSHYVTNPEERAIMKEIYDLREQGYSFDEIHQYMAYVKKARTRKARGKGGNLLSPVDVYVRYQAELRLREIEAQRINGVKTAEGPAPGATP